MQWNVAVGYAVTYIFGSLGAIIICVNILPKIMGRSIREDAIKAEQGLMHGAIILAPARCLLYLNWKVGCFWQERPRAEALLRLKR